MKRLAGAALLLLAVAPPGCGLIYDSLGGAFDGGPVEMMPALSPGARRLLEGALEGIEGPYLADFHVHLISREVNPTWVSWLHPIRRARTLVYLSASGVEWNDTLRDEYAGRLVELARELPKPARVYLYALDRHYRRDGAVDPARTAMYVSNEDVVSLARLYPDVLVPVASIHPYRGDALPALERWAAAGCRHVKWLPNAMGMDPSSSELEPFYAKMKELGMALLSHTGDEQAVDAEELQHLGNPLLLRKPLDMGLRVVALHSASDGVSVDLDSPGLEEVPSYVLLLRMLANPRYEGLLYADTSALTFYNHLPEPLLTLLDREDLHARLIHGSDYPLCALNVVIRTSHLVELGLITEEERGHLNEIYAYNPLVFDLVVKRTIRHPTSGRRFSASVFSVPEELR